MGNNTYLNSRPSRLVRKTLQNQDQDQDQGDRAAIQRIIPVAPDKVFVGRFRELFR